MGGNRRSHFVGNTHIAADFLEAGGDISPNLLDVVAEIRRDVLDEQTGHLPVSDRNNLLSNEVNL